MTTKPGKQSAQVSETPVIIEPSYTDQRTGAVYVHRDLEQRIAPWEAEGHLSPDKGTVALGSVESWVVFVKRFGSADSLLTWSDRGLQAILDYHQPDGATGRRSFIATCAFRQSVEWQAWTRAATGKPIAHREAIEFLEERSDDIREPAITDLMQILRALRANVSTTATTDLRPDGTTDISFAQAKTVKAGPSQVELPAEFKVAIPVLHGHVEGQGTPVKYELRVRLRVFVGDDGKLALRLALHNAERVMETVLRERVMFARTELGEAYPILQGA